MQMRRKKFIPIPEASDQPETAEPKIDTKTLTLDEIEEIKRKREKNKAQVSHTKPGKNLTAW
jgi:hypothetical protein